GAVGARRDLVDQRRADAHGDADVGGVDAALELEPPGEEMIDPRRDRVAVAADVAQREAAAPDVVALGRHLALGESLVAFGAPAQHHAQRVVAIGEAVGLDDHVAADDALGGEAAAVDRRPHRVDDRAHAPVGPADARHAFAAPTAPGRGGSADTSRLKTSVESPAASR